MRKKRSGFLIGFVAVLGLGLIILFLPPVWSRVVFRAQDFYASLKYKLNPPSEDVFVPGQSMDATVSAVVQQTLAALSTATPTATVEASPMPTSTQVPLPSPVLLTGIEEESQGWNNCAPTTLSMYLSYWGWKGNQFDIADVVKPNERDKNVMPYELVDYVMQNTEYQAVERVGGDLYTLKSLINAGIPVMVEKGFYIPSTGQSHNMGWMGHYELINGYDDEKGVFYTHDSYLPLIVDTEEAKSVNFTFNESNRNFEIPYADFYSDWRAFNYVFIVVYPQDKQNDVINLLGQLWNEDTANQIAYDRALAETSSLTDPYLQYFAWYNLGSSCVAKQDYSGAASAYDTAFLLVPNIDEDHRPYRNIWYQTGPYYAYFHSGRYQDVVDLATNTLNNMAEPILEESYVWRARAYIQLGYIDTAIADLRQALEAHPGFGPALDDLNSLGVAP
jgi:uncharacterized protein YvpB